MPVSAAQALDRKEVFNRLRQIPVFTLINDKGSPVLVTPKADKDKLQHATFFLNPQDVKEFQNLLNKGNPTLAKTVTVRAVPLNLAFQFGEEQKANKQPVRVDIVPTRKSVDYALTLAKQVNKDLKQFPGVPVFALTDLTGQKVVSIQPKGQSAPSQVYFLDEKDAQTTLTNLKKANPKLATQTRISAAPFENLLGLLLKLEKPADADRILVVPSTAALSYAKQLNPNPAKPAR
ncbi:Tic22 family protein [Anthocerotibacter panamensis]|uniref:Tic22 family protein n=1 Tax=Anthocerotibacter panamensis TaxID=2857077 RepID=UPI001C401B75|nr:Tic22 family protein [Anthocerotibacter panamensis]